MRTNLLRRSGRAAGFTLIELMVGIALGMAVMLALVTLIINVNRNNTEIARTSSVIENGRFTLQLLETDLSHAGFLAGWVPGYENLSNSGAPSDLPATATDDVGPDPCLAHASWDAAAASGSASYRNKLIGISVQAYAVPSSGTVSICNGTGQPLAGGNVQGNTDILVVRHLAPCVVSGTATDSDCTATASDEYFQIGRCGTTLDYTFTQAATTALAEFTKQNRDCATTASVYKFISHIYYIRNYAVTAGDGIPTLMRSTLSGGAHGTPQALIEGVESLRVEFGVDNVSKSGATLTIADFGNAVTWADTSTRKTAQNRGDGSPDMYVRCAATGCSAFNLMNTVAVKLFVLARAASRTPSYTDTRTYTLGTVTHGPYNDMYKRQVYTRTIRLQNVSMRRELPAGV